MPIKSDVEPIPAFTGLRGLAALWVVAYHFRDSLAGHTSPFVMSIVGEGFLAVDVFFILSGFIIYLNYRWLFDDFNFYSVKKFLVARFARIYPVHFFVSLLFLLNPVCILLFSQAKNLEARYDAGYYALSLFLVHNWGLTDQIEWNIPSWSISTEWFAYLMFPILVLSIGRNKNNLLFVGVEMIAILAVLAAFFLLAGVGSIGDDIPHLGLARCFLEFMIGTGICRFYLLARTPVPWLSRVLLAIVLVPMVLTAGLALPDFFLLPAAFALLIFYLTSRRSLLGRFLACKPLLVIGEMSYSIYMIHYFVKDWIKFLGMDRVVPAPYLFFVYFVLVLCAGTAVYLFVEKPGRQAFRRLVLKKI